MTTPSQLLQSAQTGGTNEWITPDSVFGPANDLLGFGLDACASPGLERLSNYISPEEDALRPDVLWEVRSGGRPVWCNPPYGRGLERWVAKAFATAQHVPVALLIFSATSTRYWHRYVMRASHVFFYTSRIMFVAAVDVYNRRTGELSLRRGECAPAPKGSSLVLFLPGQLGGPPRVWSLDIGRSIPLVLS